MLRKLLYLLAALASFEYTQAGGRTTTTTSKHTSTTTTSRTTSTSTSTSTKTTTTTTCACPTATSCNYFEYDATFDDIVNLGTAVPLQFINTYDSIYWQAMTLVTYVEGSTGNIPNSLSNLATFFVETEAVQGEAGMFADYTSSTISSFTLYSFYYGCVLDTQESVESVPTACNVTITGYNEAGSEIATQTFVFTPTGTIQNMLPAVVSTAFANAYAVVFAVTSSVADTVVAGQIDSVRYTVYGNSTTGNS